MTENLTGEMDARLHQRGYESFRFIRYLTVEKQKALLDAVEAERARNERIPALAEELAAACTTPSTWVLGDGHGGWVLDVISDAFQRHGVDLLGRHKAAPKRTPLTPAEREAIYQRDGIRCRWCGVTETLSIDHIHPVRWGGTNEPENLQVLCNDCNSWKSDRTAR